LAEKHSKKVTLVDQLPQVLTEVEIFTQWVVQGKLAELGIDVKLNHCIDRFEENRLICSEQDSVVEADAFVMALGMKPNNDLYKELEQEEIPVEMIGDAVKARKVIHAIHEGYHAGRRS